MTLRREAFIDVRKAQGHTQETFAEAIGVEVSTVRHWESGRHEPQPHRRRRIAEVLGISLAEVNALLSSPSPGHRADAHGHPHLPEPTAVSAVPFRPVEVGAAGRIDSATADLLLQRVRHLADQYDHAASAQLMAEASNLHGQLSYLPVDTSNRAVRLRLHAAAAEASILMGQLLWDASGRRDHQGALNYLATAARHADAADQDDTAALAGIRTGMVTLYSQRRPEIAAPQFEQAANRSESSALSAFAVLHHAETHAMAGNARESAATLAMAEVLIDRIDQADPASGICSARTFARMAGSCFLQLGQIPLALRFLDEARGTQTKSGAIVLANLATAHLHGNDLDAAAAHLHLAIDELERTRSGGGLQVAAEAARLLRRRGYRGAGEVGDRLIGLMASLAQHRHRGDRTVGISDDKQAIRERVWQRLEAESAVVSDPFGRIPNFHGAEEAAAGLASIAPWGTARTIKSNPDKPQAPVRTRALAEDKTLYMAVPKLAGQKPFYHLNPLLDDHTSTEAATSAVASAHAPTVEVNAMGHVDLVISGCVAVNLEGARIGKGAGYADIEVSLLIEAGLVDDRTVFVATVHDLQVLDHEVLPEEGHDFRLDWIVTPTRIIECPRSPRPRGLDWDRLPADKIAAIPALGARQPRGLQRPGHNPSVLPAYVPSGPRHPWTGTLKATARSPSPGGPSDGTSQTPTAAQRARPYTRVPGQGHRHRDVYRPSVGNLRHRTPAQAPQTTRRRAGPYSPRAVATPRDRRYPFGRLGNCDRAGRKRIRSDDA